MGETGSCGKELSIVRQNGIFGREVRIIRENDLWEKIGNLERKWVIL